MALGRWWSAGSAAVVGGVGGAVLLIVQPWGTKTVVWLIRVGGGGFLLVSLAGVSAEAVMDGRRARKRRARNP